MTRRELIQMIATRMPHLDLDEVEKVVKQLFEYMASSLETGQRIEVRGFGSFALRYRAPRKARNPKTGEKLELAGHYVPYFKPAKALKERLNPGEVEKS